MNIYDAEYKIKLSDSELFDLVFVLRHAAIDSANNYHVLEKKTWDENIIHTSRMRMLRDFAGMVQRLDMYDETLNQMEKIRLERLAKKEGGER